MGAWVCDNAVMLVWLSRRVVKDAWYVVGTWAVLAVTLLALSLGGPGGTGLFGRLEAGNSSASGTQSAQGEQILRTLAGDSQTVSLLVTGIDISDTGVQKEVASALTGAHTDLRALVGEQNVLDPFVVPGMLSEPAAQALASTELDGFLMIVTVNPNGDKVASASDKAYAEEVAAVTHKVEERLRAIPDELHSISPDATGVVSDKALMSQTVNDQVEKDLIRGEIIALPLALLVMVLVFGGFLVAGMPLIGALASIAGSLGVLYALSFFTDLQSFVVNIISVIGLGLSIDYGLLLTSRYREELARNRDDIESTWDGRLRRRRTGRRDPLIAQCMTTTLATAGRTVLFSGLTVAVALLGLVLMGTNILWSIGVAGMAVVLIAIAAALTLVPALLVLLGRRLLHPSLPQRLLRSTARRRPTGGITPESGMFSWVARQVHRMPWVVLVACVALLVVLASPLRGLHMLTSTTELLPPQSDQRTYLTALQTDYSTAAEEDATLIVAATGERVTSYINDQVASTDGVVQVLRLATAGDYTVVYLDLEGDASSVTAEHAVAGILALDAPADAWVTGQAASQYDFHQIIIHGLPWAVGLLVAASFVLLFLMTGSVLVPFKALLINTISLAASLGVLVWVFQDGHLSGLLGFTPIGGVEAYVIVTAVGVGFGLAMDYEVFILARIKEYWDGGDDNNTAVERGLQRSGGVVTSAALIMMIVFLGFVSGDLLIVKEIGLALAVMVALDATVVRMLLVPAIMSLLGRWNWWAPGFLQNVRDRYTEEAEEAADLGMSTRPSAAV